MTFMNLKLCIQLFRPYATNDERSHNTKARKLKGIFLFFFSLLMYCTFSHNVSIFFSRLMIMVAHQSQRLQVLGNRGDSN